MNSDRTYRFAKKLAKKSIDRECGYPSQRGGAMGSTGLNDRLNRVESLDQPSWVMASVVTKNTDPTNVAFAGSVLIKFGWNAYESAFDLRWLFGFVFVAVVDVFRFESEEFLILLVGDFDELAG